jgi:hypothetical protein
VPSTTAASGGLLASRDPERPALAGLRQAARLLVRGIDGVELLQAVTGRPGRHFNKAFAAVSA